MHAIQMELIKLGIAVAAILVFACVIFIYENRYEDYPVHDPRTKSLSFALALVVLFSLLFCWSHGVFGRDAGQWSMVDPETRSWYEKLMQPDNPAVSCCGEADSYWADGFDRTDKGEYIAIVTDLREDAPLKRRHVEPGTRIVVPNHKLKWDQGNPTGHGVIFLSRGDYVFCYIPPGGV